MDSQNQTTAIDTKYLKYEKGTLTIDREAFAKTDAGKYTIAFVFDDANKTMDYENVTLEVKGIIQKPDTEDSADTTESGDTADTSKDETTV